MIPRAYEVSHLSPQIVFDPVDVYARERRVAGPHPRPAGRLDFQLVAEMVAGQPQELEPPVRLEVTTNPGGYSLFLGRVVGEDGSARRLRLDDGEYVVRVTAPGYQAVERTVTVPPPPAPAFPVEMHPGATYPFPRASSLGAGRGPTLLRGVLERVDGSGIGGAEIGVAGVTDTFRTAPDGGWVLVFADSQPAGPVTVKFRLPQAGGGFQDVDVAGVEITPGASTSFLQTSLTGRVGSVAGMPVEGAEVTVVGRPGATASRPDGTWRYVFPVDAPPAPGSQVDVRAEHPGGASQVAPGVPVEPASSTSVPPFLF